MLNNSVQLQSLEEYCLEKFLFKTFIGDIYYSISFSGSEPCNMCLYKKITL